MVIVVVKIYYARVIREVNWTHVTQCSQGWQCSFLVREQGTDDSDSGHQRTSRENRMRLGLLRII
jgi:hypothetical protein